MSGHGRAIPSARPKVVPLSSSVFINRPIFHIGLILKAGSSIIVVTQPFLPIGHPLKTEACIGFINQPVSLLAFS
jgi:hypothetical protein